MLRDGNKETARYAYRDEAGNLKGYVFRIEKADGSKITPPLAYCENEKGFKAWKWQAFEKENKTPYGIEKLAQNPTQPILVVEGEKTADAAQKLLPECNVLTWSGGAGNVGKTNWECLAGREVVIWPDNDAGGLKAADTLQEIVSSVNMEKGVEGKVGIVPLPHDLPEKWDLADKLPESWTVETVKQMIKDANPSKDKMLAHKQKDTGTLSDAHKPGANIENAANEFIGLCVLFENTPWGTPGDKELSRKIEALAGQYIQNKEFRHRIEACGNEIAIERLQTEIEEQMPTLKDIQSSSLTPASDTIRESGTTRAIVDDRKTATNIEKAANQFIDLCALYENTPWGNPGEKELSRKIEAVAGQYMQNEEFRQRIATCENDIVINRFQIEMEEQTPSLNNTQPSGLKNDAGLADDSASNSLGVAHKADTNLEKVANEFIDLCVLYKNIPWGDPSDKQTLRKIEALAGKHMHNEEFRQRIESSKNEIAINRLEIEIEEQKQNMSQSISKGM